MLKHHSLLRHHTLFRQSHLPRPARSTVSPLKTNTRAMSSETPKHLFFVYAPDYTDADAFSRRMAVREKHLVHANELVGSGVASMYSSPSAFTLKSLGLNLV